LDLQTLLDRQRAAFAAADFPTASDRREDLRRLEALIRRHQDALLDAISADFGNRSRHETVLSEILPVLAAAAHARRHVARWMRPRRRAVGLNFQPASNRVEYQPLGVVGVVSPWNYPVFLTLGPLVDILAAGNRAMIKPSELTPATSALLARLLGAAFPPEQIVAEDYDIDAAAQSVAVGKFFNAGQTCTAPDYALVPAAGAERFAQGVLQAATSMYPRLAGNPDYTAVISDRHYQRLGELVAEAEAAGATVLRHPQTPSGNVRHFPPTVVLDPPLDGRLMRDEIFGPILPVLRIASTDAAIAFVNARPRPLALYAYTKDAARERKILDRTISGGVTINATLMHTGQADLPFGGVGPSGMGAYHAAEGFYQFSHARGIHKPGFFSGFEFLRPPHGRATRLALRALGIKLA
jgi:coniferyl-aldehyde dehydrogenase